VRSAKASAVAVSGVPQWTIARRSLSSEAAASLMIALTCAASATGSFGPASNHSEACGAPPRSRASSRTMRAETISRPHAALASVLAISIAA
jgi:hypothetical protein